MDHTMPASNQLLAVDKDAGLSLLISKLARKKVKLLRQPSKLFGAAHGLGELESDDDDDGDRPSGEIETFQLVFPGLQPLSYPRSSAQRASSCGQAALVPSVGPSSPARQRTLDPAMILHRQSSVDAVPACLLRTPDPRTTPAAKWHALGQRGSRLQLNLFRREKQLGQTQPPAVLAEPAPIGASVLSKMLGHSLPYAWLLAHEINLDEQFRFSKTGVAVPSAGQRKAVEIYLRAMAETEAETLAVAMRQMSQPGESCEQREKNDTIVAGAMAQVEHLWESVVGSKADANSKAIFDSKLLCQMVRQGIYSSKGLIDFVEHVAASAGAASMMAHPPIMAWLEEIKHTPPSEGDDVFGFAAEAIFGLLDQLRELRAAELNIQLVFMRPALVCTGPAYERSFVLKTVENGELKLDRTAEWLDAHTQPGESAAGSFRRGMGALLAGLAMQNKSWVETEALPEVLCLDVERLRQFRDQLRSLALTTALHTMATAFLKKHRVPVTEEQRTELKERISEALDEASSRQAVAEAVADEMRALVQFQEKWPELEPMLLSAMKRGAGSMRVLFTQRISDALVTADAADEEAFGLAAKSFGVVAHEAKELAKQVQRLCTHLEYVFMPLFVSLLHNK